jgi:nucleotide-binding universal stress UspA family protein
VEPIIVGIDFSPASGAAWAWACNLAELTGSPILAVSAVEHKRHDAIHTPLDVMRNHVEEGLISWLRTQTPGSVEARAVVRYDDPRRVLHDVGEEQNASLIVVGRPRAHGGPGLWKVRSIAEHLAHNSSRPIAIVPERRRRRFDTVLVAVDGSQESEAAVRWCVPLAKTRRVRVLAAAVDRPNLKATVEERITRRHQLRSTIHESWARPLAEHTGYVGDVVEHSYDVSGGLVALAGRHRADALVVGMRPLGRMLHRRAGGVSIATLHDARCPVVLVPASADLREESQAGFAVKS